MPDPKDPLSAEAENNTPEAPPPRPGPLQDRERMDVGCLTSEEEYEQRTLVVAHGGEGGEGTGVVMGRQQQRGVQSRRPRIPPQGGEKRRLKLTLKIVADVAVVGVPNAGKSTFLAAVTRAKPKIANVRFFVSCVHTP